MQPIEQNAEFDNLAIESGKRGNKTLDQVKSTVADKLHSVAETLHQRVERGNQQDELSNYGRRAANWLDQSADYVSDFQPERARRDVENKIRQNPGRSLLIAGAVGLLLGGLLRRR